MCHALRLQEHLDNLEKRCIRVHTAHQNDFQPATRLVIDGFDTEWIARGSTAIGGAHQEVCEPDRGFRADRIDLDDAGYFHVALASNRFGFEGRGLAARERGKILRSNPVLFPYLYGLEPTLTDV